MRPAPAPPPRTFPLRPTARGPHPSLGCGPRAVAVCEGAAVDPRRASTPAGAEFITPVTNALPVSHMSRGRGASVTPVSQALSARRGASLSEHSLCDRQRASGSPTTSPGRRRGARGEVLLMTDRSLWSYKDIAAHIRVQPDTVRSYRKHGLLPPPDHVESGKPYWYATRSGHGWPPGPATGAAPVPDHLPPPWPAPVGAGRTVVFGLRGRRRAGAGPGGNGAWRSATAASRPAQLHGSTTVTPWPGAVPSRPGPPGTRTAGSSM